MPLNKLISQIVATAGLPLVFKRGELEVEGKEVFCGSDACTSDLSFELGALEAFQLVANAAATSTGTTGK